MHPRSFRLGLLLAVAVIALPILTGLADDNAQKSARQADPPKNEYFKGKVLPLADALKKLGVKLDADAAPYWLALVTDEGTLQPLVKDAGSRMLYQDKRLRNRPMRLTARRVPGCNMLQVINVHSYIDGKLHEVYYWCDICTIRGYQFTICDCCGGPMVKHEDPVK